MIPRILVMALVAATLLVAADPTGTWTGDQPIQNGKIHGDDLSFTVHLDFGDGIDLK